MDDTQKQLWNGAAGQAWVRARPLIDEVFQPFTEVLVDAARDCGARQVMDIGCGTGAVTRALSAALGDAAACLGVDVSAAMVDEARRLANGTASRARFLCADAATHAFPPAAADLMVSRFGIMFFADPVAAFAHLRSALADRGRLCGLAWRDPAENPFMTLAERTARPWLPDLPERRPGAPGQFAFADAGHVRSIFDAAGWRAADIRPLDIECSMPAQRIEEWFTSLGPVGLAMPSLDTSARDALIEALRNAFAPFVRGQRACFTAACWRIDAQR
ncbi:class I SAM-dependent methyltransferase [Methyloversatilis thermotolerans]|uniref:class I SAM-dependent methyltransferase n=1 Tax=Methyloversatilis thermotolerans TaxID=1346290 RepID=UPI000373D566|nr:class I SAM-dependent methyltransferase [Methyloversatilis thermotolerans]